MRPSFVRDHLHGWAAKSGLDVGLAIIFLAGLIVGLPCLLYGFPFYGDDSISQAVAYSRFAEQVWQGDLYPRWLGGMNGGLGSTFFYSYPPLPYYLTIVFRFFFSDDQFGWRQLGLGAVTAIIASGFALYVWLRPHVGRWPAVGAAIVYLAMPYHVNVDLYLRGAYAELWSFAWMPLILFAVDRVNGKRRWAVPFLAVSYLLLVTTHLPTTLIFSLVPPAYCFSNAAPHGRLRNVSLTVVGMLLGIGLAAIYLIPALALQRFSFQSEGTIGHFFYGNWFLFTGLTWSGGRSDLFWFTLEVCVLAFLAFVIALQNGLGRLKQQSVFWLLVAATCLFMMSPLSRTIWAWLPTLQKIQFPWRFNTVLSLAAAALLAFALASLKWRWSWSAGIMHVTTIILIGLWIYDVVPRAWYSYPIHYLDRPVVEERNRALEQNRDQNEFRPRWVVSIKEKDLSALLQTIGKTPEVPGTAWLSTPGRVAIEKWDSSQVELSVATTEPATVRISQFYFPGWEARFAGGVTLAIKPSVPGGLVSVEVPAGSHRLQIRRVYTSPEIAGLIVSGVSLLIIILMTGLIAVNRRLEFNLQVAGTQPQPEG